MSSIKARNSNNATALSKFVWDLEDKKIKYNISWNILGRGKPYNHISKTCRLCLRENFFIIYHPNMSKLNRRSEISNNCRHIIGQLLTNS